MSSKKKIVSVVFLFASVICLILLIVCLIQSFKSVEEYQNYIRWDIQSGFLETVPIYRTIINQYILKICTNFLSIFLLIGFNLYIWFWHKIPTPEEQARMKEERKAKKLEKLQEKVEKMKNE